MTRVSCFLFLLFLLAACAGLPSSRPDFAPAQENFAQRLRWRDFAAASRYLPFAEQEEFCRRLGELADLHITDIRLESAAFSPEGNRVVTWNVLEYYLLPSTTVKTLRYRQEWALLGADRLHSGEWLIVTPFPDIPMSGREPPQ